MSSGDDPPAGETGGSSCDHGSSSDHGSQRRQSRRQLLAAVATGVASSIAGCGYAYGGGDVRGEASITGANGDWTEPPRPGPDVRVAAVSDGPVHVPGAFGETAVVVGSLDGSSRSRYTYDGSAVDVALGNDPYLLDGDGRVVALERVRVERDDRATRMETQVAWEVEFEAAEQPLVADEHGVYLSAGDRLVAVRDGEVAWERQLAGSIETLATVDDTVLVTTDASALAVASSDGDERWRVTHDGVVDVAVTDDRTVVASREGSLEGDADVLALETRSGERHWTATVGEAHRRLVASTEAVGVFASDSVTVFDSGTGAEHWTTSTTGRWIDRLVVPAPEGAYVLADCTVVAVDDDGVRWRRDLDVRRRCGGVVGWLEGERVGLLLGDGDVRWLQRSDQDRGLL